MKVRDLIRLIEPDGWYQITARKPAPVQTPKSGKVTVAAHPSEQLIREGIEFHIEGLRADGDPVPEPTTRVIEIAVPA